MDHFRVTCVTKALSFSDTFNVWIRTGNYPPHLCGFIGPIPCPVHPGSIEALSLWVHLSFPAHSGKRTSSVHIQLYVHLCMYSWENSAIWVSICMYRPNVTTFYWMCGGQVMGSASSLALHLCAWREGEKSILIPRAAVQKGANKSCDFFSGASNVTQWGQESCPPPTNIFPHFPWVLVQL